jgi:molybdate transport system substrate-binding protein
MKSVKWIKGLAVAACVICAAIPAFAQELRIFAAASLQGPLDRVAHDWAQDAVISYGGSGAIARQISLGAPADIVILANSAWADWLVENGHAPGPVRDVISNRLVLVGPARSPVMPEVNSATLLERLGDGRLAMGQHMSVPAGIYGKAWLERIGAWDTIRTKLAETENVRAALALVARGEAPVGLVYASDAAAENSVSVIWTVPAEDHPPIRYPALSLTETGAEFLDYLLTRSDVFVASGFAALP